MRALGLLFLALMAGLAAPQTEPQLPEQARARLEALEQRLALTLEQSGQARPVLAEEMRQLRDLRERSQGGQNRRDRMKMAREARSIRESADEKLRKILSKQQMDELAKIREERRDEARERKKSAR